MQYLGRWRAAVLLVMMAIALVGGRASAARAALDTGLCRSNTSRGAIPPSFAVEACFDGTTLYVHNDRDLALGVAVQGSVGHPKRTETNYDLEVDAARLKSKDPDVLLPGDTLAFPIGSSTAKVRLRGTDVTSFYGMADIIAHFFPIPKAGALFEDYTQLVAELNEDGTKYLACRARSRKRLHRVACELALKGNTAFAVGRFVVHGGLALAKSEAGKIAGLVVTYVEGGKWVKDQVTTVAAELHSGTIALVAAPAAAPPPPPAVTVPAIGPTLVYTGYTADDPSAGDTSFSGFSLATGENADVVDTLPNTLSGYRCTVLLANTAFDASDTATLKAFLDAGGTILALGEHSGDGFDDADTALNSLASSLGATGLSLDDDSYDDGDDTTSAVVPSSFTAGVATLGDNWVSSVSVSDPATPLVYTSDDDSVPLVGVQSIGAGMFVMGGDTNMFSDNNDDFYGSDDNGAFGQDLCP